MPEIIDPEGSDVALDFLFGNTGLFTIYDEDTRELVFDLQDENAIPGRYRIFASLEDESNNVRTFLLVLIEANTPPFFETDPDIGHIEGSMKQGSGLNTYVLSRMYDNEDDEIFVQIFLEEVEIFAEYDS